MVGAERTGMETGIGGSGGAMIRFLIQRALVLILRLLASALILLTLIESGFVIFGGAGRHVWEISLSGSAPVELGGGRWVDLLLQRSVNSGIVLLFSFGGGLLVGYSWGVLGGRLRKFGGSLVLAAPWNLLSCVPAFWFVVVTAIFSFFEWQRPGFANDLVVETGPDLLRWWNAAVVAVPLLGLAASWQLQAVAETVEREAARPFVKALFLAGYRDDDIFYSNILKRARPGMIDLFDRTLPAILGGLVIAEWAFHYEGIGSLLVDSVKAGSYAGIFLCGMWMSLLIGMTSLLREWVSQTWSQDQ